MSRGPLPNPQRRRRNEPTIATSDLPAAGRKGRIPKCPYDLGEAGDAWWKWAWRLPQATRWDDGALFFVARRALLEDHRAALRFSDELDAHDVFATMDPEAMQRVRWALSLLKQSATGEVALMKEMRELDNRLGLNPKAMGDLRWKVGVTKDTAPTEAQVLPLKMVRDASA